MVIGQTHDAFSVSLAMMMFARVQLVWRLHCIIRSAMRDERIELGSVGCVRGRFGGVRRERRARERPLIGGLMNVFVFAAGSWQHLDRDEGGWSRSIEGLWGTLRAAIVLRSSVLRRHGFKKLSDGAC